MVHLLKSVLGDLQSQGHNYFLILNSSFKGKQCFLFRAKPKVFDGCHRPAAYVGDKGCGGADRI